VLRPFYGFHVLSAFERSGIGAPQLAHAALHLFDGFVFPILHEPPQALFETASRLFSQYKKKLLQLKGATLVIRNKAALEKMVIS
jgi:hypothetical protein